MRLTAIFIVPYALVRSLHGYLAVLPYRYGRAPRGTAGPQASPRAGSTLDCHSTACHYRFRIINFYFRYTEEVA